MSELRRRKATTKREGSANQNKKSLSDHFMDVTPQATINRILVRLVVIVSLSVIIYFAFKNNKVITFAVQSQQIPGKGLTVECSSEYLKDINTYEGCLPQECGRYVTDTVVSKPEVQALLSIAKKVLAHSKSSGGASILDLHSGALSKGDKFINIYKNEATKDLVKPEDYQVYKTVKEKIKYSIAQHFAVQPDKIYLTHPTFFSELTAIPPVSVHDEYWHPHVDKETYVSFHYTTLLYLGDYGIDFEGGRFVFIDTDANRTVEPRRGRVSMFTSGAENTHFVEKVTKGERYAMTISFTCDEKHSIADPMAKF